MTAKPVDLRHNLLTTIFPVAPELPQLLLTDLYPLEAQLLRVLEVMTAFGEQQLRQQSGPRWAAMNKCVLELFETVRPWANFQTSVTRDEDYFYEESVFAEQLQKMTVLDPLFAGYYQQYRRGLNDSWTFSTVLALGTTNLLYLLTEAPGSAIRQPHKELVPVPFAAVEFTAKYAALRDMLATMKGDN